KAFVNSFSESLRGELKRAGVHVTLLAPGPVRETLPDAAEQSLVEKLIPDFLWISTEYTAKLSLDGLERNKMRVVPGVTSKAMSVASGYTPRSIVTPIVGAVYKKLGRGQGSFGEKSAPAAGRAEDAAGDLAADDGARRAHGALERRAGHHLLEHAGLGRVPRLHLPLGARPARLLDRRRQRSVSGWGRDLRLPDFGCRLLLEK